MSFQHNKEYTCQNTASYLRRCTDVQDGMLPNTVYTSRVQKHAKKKDSYSEQ